MKQAVKVLNAAIHSRKSAIVLYKDVLRRSKSNETSEKCKRIIIKYEQLCDEYRQAINILNDSSAKICPDGEQPTTEVEPNNSGDAPNV